MTGSEKQIKWAEDIKANIEWPANMPAAAQKVADYINSIDDARFWIDNRDLGAMALMKAAATSGLQIKGKGMSYLAKIDANLLVTITHNEIISNGKGGHEKTVTETIQL